MKHWSKIAYFFIQLGVHIGGQYTPLKFEQDLEFSTHICKFGKFCITQKVFKTRGLVGL